MKTPLTTGQKLDDFAPGNKIEVFEVRHQTTQEIESEAEDTFRRVAVLLQLQLFDNCLPLADHERPGEGQREQGQSAAQALRVFQRSVFQIEATRLQRPEERLNAPTLLILLTLELHKILAKPGSGTRRVGGNTR